MEEILIIDAAERYMNGEMNHQERAYFEQLRKDNPEVDQIIAEHIFFVHEMQKYADVRKMKSLLSQVHHEAVNNGIPDANPKNIKPISIWKKYSKTIAVAASITVFSTFLCTTLLNNYNKKNQPNIKPLVEKIYEQDQKYKDLEIQIGKLNQENLATPETLKPKIRSNFRATGFMVDADMNLIATNAHVVNEAAHKLIVENNNGDQFEARSIFVDANADLAIIQITDPLFKKMSPIPYVIDDNDAEIGKTIFTLGYPKQEIVYGEGYVSAANGYQMDTSFFQLSTAANEGNSGSPVITTDGKIIGVISSTETDAEGVVFAIKSKKIINALQHINKDSYKAATKNQLQTKERSNQIKKVVDYVYMIKGN
jgi:S1-C subfamily serine protease